MRTHTVVRLAIGQRAAVVARALGVHVSLVYRHAAAPTSVRFHNFYELFLRWLRAIFRANRPGAELLVSDLEAQIAELRATHARTLGTSGEFNRQLLACEVERTEVLRLKLERATEEQQLAALLRLQAAIALLVCSMRTRVARRRAA